MKYGTINWVIGYNLRREVKMIILIGADIAPTVTNQYIFENAQMEKIVDKRLRAIFSKADYRIFNLEVPLTDLEEPIKKCGPNLIASTASAAGLKQLGIDFLTLANNHILDQGEKGMWSTIEQLDKVGIAYAGIGRNPVEAARPYIVELDNKKIGIYCCAEHEFSIVSEKKAGANPFDPLESLDHIADLKTTCDYVICLYHGGKEHYRYPSPNLRKTCRKIVEKGADLVICQHTHCIGCEEKWLDGTIIYGQGNFLFDYSKSEFWQTSLLVSFDVSDGSIDYIPICKDGNSVILAQGMEKKKILSDFNNRSLQIKEVGFVEKQYAEFSKSMISIYLNRGDLLTGTLVFRLLNKISNNKLMLGIEQKKLKRHRMALINQYECESHRELILKGLEVSAE